MKKDKEVILFTLIIDRFNTNSPIQGGCFKFDPTDQEDIELIEQYSDEEDTFEEACRRFLYETEILSWEQGFCQGIILNQNELTLLKAFEFK